MQLQNVIYWQLIATVVGAIEEEPYVHVTCDVIAKCHTIYQQQTMAGAIGEEPFVEYELFLRKLFQFNKANKSNFVTQWQCRAQ